MSTRRKIIKDNKLYNGKSTKATHFLLPFYGMGKSYYTDYLISVNIKDDPHEPRVVFVFDNFDEEELLMHLYKLHNHHCFDESWNDDEDKEVCLSMKIPKEFLNDYRLFLDGKYSQFSEKYKELLIKLYGRGVHPTFQVDEKGHKIGFSETGHKVSVYEAISPTHEKRLAIGRRLGLELPKDAEVFDRVNLEEESYLSIKELKEKYGVK